jgi:anthranilate phosphoribosyltransferase
MILVIDNFDSFTYNIVQYLERMGLEVLVKRNNEITVAEITKLSPSHIVISPGPSDPDHAGISLSVIKELKGKFPILGVCLGHQAIGQAFGGKVIRAKQLFHGKTSLIRHDGKGVFSGVPSPLLVARYHSLVIEKDTCPEELEVTAMSEDGEIMAVRHKTLAVEGVQFHPESIATEHGFRLLENFVKKRELTGQIKEALPKLRNGESLSREEAASCMEEITGGSVSPSLIAAFLTALSIKGENAQEIAGFAGVLRAKSIAVVKPKNQIVVDTCGTGGDKSGTFNISTTAALIASGAGVVIAKHGNRSVTSTCGSADLLESFGVKVDLAPERISAALEKLGVAFLYAPAHHPGMKHAGPVRKELGFRTVFNLLGPLANPAGADAQVLGVFSLHLTHVLAEVLVLLGVKRAVVVHGHDGLDEITLTTSTRISEVKDGWIRTFDFHPSEIGLTCCLPSDLKGDGLERNKDITLKILQGEKSPRRDIVCLNAAAALLVAGKVDSLKAGFALAVKSIESGAALKKLEALQQFS